MISPRFTEDRAEKAYGHQTVRHRTFTAVLLVLTALASDHAYADTLGPELICDKKEARGKAVVCIEYRVFDVSGQETRASKPIPYEHCPKGFSCTWDTAADAARR